MFLKSCYWQDFILVKVFQWYRISMFKTHLLFRQLGTQWTIFLIFIKGIQYPIMCWHTWSIRSVRHVFLWCTLICCSPWTLVLHCNYNMSGKHDWWGSTLVNNEYFRRKSSKRLQCVKQNMFSFFIEILFRCIEIPFRSIVKRKAVCMCIPCFDIWKCFIEKNEIVFRYRKKSISKKYIHRNVFSLRIFLCQPNENEKYSSLKPYDT